MTPLLVTVPVSRPQKKKKYREKRGLLECRRRRESEPLFNLPKGGTKKWMSVAYNLIVLFSKPELKNRRERIGEERKKLSLRGKA